MTSANVAQLVRVARHANYANGFSVNLQGQVNALAAARHLVNGIHVHFRNILFNQLAGGLVQRANARWVCACDDAPFFIHDIDIAVQNAANALGNFLRVFMVDQHDHSTFICFL